MALRTLAFYSKCKVILDTQSMGPVDVSDDVISCSVSLRLNAVSTVSVSLNNYSNQISGRYNFLLAIGDKAHISFILNGVEYPQLTGRIFSAPLVSFDAASFQIEIQDCIGDLSWQFWCPYSAEAQSKYLTWNEENITEAAEELGEADSGMGNVLLDFMENVCRFPKGSIYIQKFPDLGNVMKNILKTIVCNKDPNLENEYEAIFMQLFGSLSNQEASADAATTVNGITIDANGAMELIQSLTGSKRNSQSSFWWRQSAIQVKDVAKSTDHRDMVTNFPQREGGTRSGLYGLTLEQCKNNMPKGQKANYASYLSTANQQAVFTSVWQSLLAQSNGDPCLAFLNYWLPGTNQQFHGKTKGGIQAGGKNGATALLVINGDVINERSKIANLLSEAQKKLKTVPAGDNKKWQEWLAKYPIGKGSYATADNATQYLGEQCWSLYETYTHFLFGWNYQGGPNYQPDGQNSTGKIGNGAYWQMAKDRTANAEVLKEFDVLGPNAVAKTGDVAFWSQSGGINDSLGAEYGHVAIVMEDLGSQLKVENQWLGSGGVVESTWPKNEIDSVRHWKLAGYLRPKMFAGDSLSASSQMDLPTGTSDQTSELYNEMFELFKFVQFDNQSLVQESANLDQYDNLYDNVPVLGFVDSLCKASMRSYTSLPDGSFTAFVPDHFGYFSNANPDYDNLVTLDPVNLIDYKVSINKAGYKSHVFCLTSEFMPDLWGSVDSGLSTSMKLMQSSGIVSLQRNPKELAHLISLDGTGFSTSSKGISQLLQTWGVSVLKHPDPNIESHVMTAIEAVYLFVESWASLFQATLNVSFMPELRPGLRLELPNLGIKCFIDSVTHTWTASGGGSTSIQVNSIMNNDGRAGF